MTFDVKLLSSQLKNNLASLGKLKIASEVENPYLMPYIKYAVLLSSSLLKTRLLLNEILKLTDENRFLPAIAVLRMAFEELMMLTYILFKIEKMKNWSEADKLLIKAGVGRMHGRGESSLPEEYPFRINEMLEKSEKYVGNNFSKLSGVFKDTYSFISDFVHPNAPSRLIFTKIEKGKTLFVYTDKVDGNDLGMVLNYGCMTSELYFLIWRRLKEIKMPINTKNQILYSAAGESH